MELTYFVKKTVEIPDARLQEIVDALLEKWEHLSANSDIHVEDILNQASSMGIIDMPENWHTDDESVTAAEIAWAVNGPKKNKRKKTK